MSANNADRWGKMRPETMRLLLDLFCDGQDGRKACVAWLCGIIRTGDNLADRERNDLIRWLGDKGYPTTNLGRIHTVQYTNDECAAAIGCDVKQARRYRDWMVRNDVLIPVQTGKKGYPGFFVLAPVMGTNSCDIVPVNKGTIDNGLGDNRGEIGGHSNPTTCANADISRVIQSNPEKCEKCGNVVELSPNGCMRICASCNTAWEVMGRA